MFNNNGVNEPAFFKWGLIPSWSKDENIGRKMINARAETVDTKPSFPKLLKHRRCLIPSDGFYEWKSVNGVKTSLLLLFMKKKERQKV
ncbi:MAG: SOS response-associated peptidase [Caldicoprobacterales bacterium]|jgi:putative SOS response-associated peptidase YedK